MRKKAIAVLVALLLLTAAEISAQEEQNAGSENASAAVVSLQLAEEPDFDQLSRVRRQLISSQNRLERELTEIRAKLAETESADYLEFAIENHAKRLRENKATLEQLETKYEGVSIEDSNLTPEQLDDLDKIRYLQRVIADSPEDLERTKKELDAFRNLESDLAAKEKQLNSVVELINDVERRIAGLLDIERDKNDFRLWISVSFCLLVGLVILGFYFIAFNKDEIASTIFAGEKGIQFVTLFLIVIAIILFGIMSILEGKELAALLGGLSGYILGRSSVGASVNPPTG